MRNLSQKFHAVLVRVLYLSLGVFGGLILSSLWAKKPAPTASCAAALPPAGASDCAAELRESRARVAELQEASRTTEPLRAEPTPDRAGDAPGPNASSSAAGAPAPASATSPEAIAWRISAIEKFVPLTDEQRSRLEAKFRRESDESLEEILGGESAAFYREQVNTAFKKAEEEELDRDIVWLARQLQLSPDQERRVGEIFRAIEAEIEAASESAGAKALTPAERVSAMIAENRRRSELRAERLKDVLAPDQFAVFIRSQAESPASDVEVFHGGN